MTRSSRGTREELILRSPTTALLLYRLLEECKRGGIERPHGTAHITCDVALCAYLSQTVLAMQDGERIIHLDYHVVKRAFIGQPVAQVFGVVNSTALKIHSIMERDIYLRNRGRRRLEGDERVA